MKVYEDSPAATAGLKYGDRIEAVNGISVVSGSEMVDAIEKYPGETIQLTVARGDQKLNLAVVPNIQVGGLTFHPDNVQNGLPQLVAVGAYGREVVAGGLAAGDVITAVDSQPVHSVPELLEAFQKISRAHSGGVEEIQVSLTRQGNPQPAQVSMLALDAWPVGKIGIMPAQVTEFQFIDQTTSVVSGVVPGSPAQQAGFLPQDILYLVNGRSIADVNALDEVLGELSTGVASADPLRFDVARAGEHVRLELDSRPANTGELGLQLQPVTFGLVVQHSFWLIGKLIVAPVIIVQQLAAKVLNPDLVKASMSGWDHADDLQLLTRVKVPHIAPDQRGSRRLNIIPFPALDGARRWSGHMHGARGQSWTKKEALVHQVGSSSAGHPFHPLTCSALSPVFP